MGFVCSNAQCPVSPTSEEERLGSQARFNEPGSGQLKYDSMSYVTCSGIGLIGQRLEQPMNETRRMSTIPSRPGLSESWPRDSDDHLAFPMHSMRSDNLLFLRLSAQEWEGVYDAVRYLQRAETLSFGW